MNNNGNILPLKEAFLLITLIRPAYYDAPRCARFSGLSTDEKPQNVGNGTAFKEIDTSKYFLYDEDSKQWVEQQNALEVI